MTKRTDLLIRILIAALLAVLALTRLTYHDSLSGKMDAIFFALLGASLMLILIPVQNLKSFKAGGFELSLDHPHVQGAISGLGLDRIEDEKLRSRLLLLQSQLVCLRGSRILWIDDRPHKIIAERRLLRALGADVTTATTSAAAESILKDDNDFDLIITDVQREGDSYLSTKGVRIHEGVNYIVKLRTDPKTDPVIKTIPVIFFAAYEWPRLLKFTLPARSLYPPPEVSNWVVDLVPKAIKLLTEARATPIKAGKLKTPTSVRRPPGAEADSEAARAKSDADREAKSA